MTILSISLKMRSWLAAPPNYINQSSTSEIRPRKLETVSPMAVASSQKFILSPNRAQRCSQRTSEAHLIKIWQGQTLIASTACHLPQANMLESLRSESRSGPSSHFTVTQLRSSSMMILPGAITYIRLKHIRRSLSKVATGSSSTARVSSRPLCRKV